MGPKCCKTKHMANLDGTPSDPGWDLDGPRRSDPGGGLDGTPKDSNRLLGLSEMCAAQCASQKITFATRYIFTAISALITEIHCDVGHDASITTSAMLRYCELGLGSNGPFFQAFLNLLQESGRSDIIRPTCRLQTGLKSSFSSINCFAPHPFCPREKGLCTSVPVKERKQGST